MNKILKFLFLDNQVAVNVIEATDMVNEAIKIHNLSPVCAAAMGRTMIASTFMASMLKSKEDKLTVIVKGDGPCGKITVCGNGNLQMRACIDNPSVFIPLKQNGKLDVGSCVGKNGKIVVIRSLGLKDSYTGSSALVSGEIAEDFTSYYAISEQQPTAMALGVKIGTDSKCLGAGGVIIQALPDASENNLIIAENLIRSLNNISSLIIENGAEGIAKKFFNTTDFNEKYFDYHCLCNRKNIEDVLFSLGRKEVDDILAKEKKVEVKCQFCNKNYVFNSNDIEKLFNLHK